MPSEAKRGELSPLASHFVAGLLEHLPGLMALTAPSLNSYRRLQPSTWSGAYRVHFPVCMCVLCVHVYCMMHVCVCMLYVCVCVFLRESCVIIHVLWHI